MITEDKCINEKISTVEEINDILNNCSSLLEAQEKVEYYLGWLKNEK